MNRRLENTLATLRRDGRTGLAAYLVAGDPDPETTLRAMVVLVESGVRLLELGMPFSDPVADGFVVAQAHGRALRGGMTMGGTMELVARFRRTDRTTPVVLMGYVNPVLNVGADTFFEAAAMSGADGAILVDVPLEHAGPFRDAAHRHALSFVPLWAPTASTRREKQILSTADTFVYLVSRTGITGGSTIDLDAVKERAGRARREHGVGLAAGFGIREPAQVASLARSVDLVVVGSRFVEILGAKGDDGIEELGCVAKGLVGALVDAS